MEHAPSPPRPRLVERGISVMRLHSHSTVRTRPWALASAMLGLAASAIYVGVILIEGNNTITEVAPWTATMLTASLLAFVGAVVPERSVAKGSLLTAIAIFAVLGVLALFSIGTLFIIAAALAAVAFGHVTRNAPETEPDDIPHR
jgi:hypothetical protein